MNAKEFLYAKGITDDPSKGLFVKRDDIEFTIADLMDEYANQRTVEPQLQTTIEGNNLIVSLTNTDSFGNPLTCTKDCEGCQAQNVVLSGSHLSVMLDRYRSDHHDGI